MVNTGNEYVEDLKRFWSIRSTNNPDVLFMFARVDYKCSKIKFSKTQLWKVSIFLYFIPDSIQNSYSTQSFYRKKDSVSSRPWPKTANIRRPYTLALLIEKRHETWLWNIDKRWVLSWPSKKCLLIWPLEKSSGRVNLQNQNERIKKDFWKTFLLLKMYKKSTKGFV